MFAFAFRAIASGNRIANLFLFVCWKKEGSGQFSCWGLNPDQRIESPVPYPLRQLAHCFESQILRAKLSRDSKFLKSLQTKKSRNARHANTRSAKHQCETSVSRKNSQNSQLLAQISAKFPSASRGKMSVNAPGYAHNILG